MSETPGEIIPSPPAPPPAKPAPETPRRRIPPQPIVVAAAAVLVVIALIVAAPLWAPPVMRALPWGSPERLKEPTKPAPQAAAPAPDPAVATLKAQATQISATVQQLTQYPSS
jgi:hypothetical protein